MDKNVNIVRATKQFLLIEDRSINKGGIFRRKDSAVVNYSHGPKWQKIISHAESLNDHQLDIFLQGEFRLMVKDGYMRKFGHA